MHLSAHTNPHPTLDYIVEFTLTLAEHTQINLRYVPDKHVLEASEILDCAETLHRQSGSLEPLAHLLIEEINNAIIPRWVRVEIIQASPALTQRVVMEDRQPKWDNAFLISRMQKL